MSETTKLFGSSGVRGLINENLKPELAVKIGLAVATLHKGGKILVARDTRVSGAILEEALGSGLLAGGADVNLLGITPTPALAYLTRKLDADAGVMITASHNPPQYNGFKIFSRDSAACNEDEQGKLEEIIKSDHFSYSEWSEIRKSISQDQNCLYAQMIETSVKLSRKWHIVVDPGCGATCSLGPRILWNLGCRVTAVNAQPDGFFPGRSSEPNAESLRPLAEIVKEVQAEIGVAYDGDGDRVAFIDERGSFVDFDRILAAYTAYVTRINGGGFSVTNIEASMCVEKMVEAQGGVVVRTKVGDVYIAEAIKKKGAIFGGEPCGAWIHPRSHYCPDGILSSALILEALEEKGKKLSELISETPKYRTLRENVECRNDSKHDIVTNIEARMKRAFPAYKDFSDIDGTRLALKDGWVLVRASGTEPVIRLTVEGESFKVAKRIMDQSLRLVRKAVKEKRK